MDRFLGLPLVRKPLTDVEHVERVRKGVEQARCLSKWYALVTGIFAVLWLYLFVRCLQWMVGGFLGIPGNQLLVGLGFGVSFGLMFGIMALKCGHMVADAVKMWKGDRTAELLVKYHDMLVDLARSEENATSPEQAEQSRGGQGSEAQQAKSERLTPIPNP